MNNICTRLDDQVRPCGRRVYFTWSAVRRVKRRRVSTGYSTSFFPVAAPPAVPAAPPAAAPMAAPLPPPAIAPMTAPAAVPPPIETTLRLSWFGPVCPERLVVTEYV